MLHPDDLPEGVEVADLVVKKYTVNVLVPRELGSDAPKAATLEGWFEYDRGRSLAEDVTGMGPSPRAIVCEAGRHIIGCPHDKVEEQVARDCDFCIGEAEAAYERRQSEGY